MTTDDARRILMDIDAVEADLRRLESRLTYIRERIHGALLGGKMSKYHPDGRKKSPADGATANSKTPEYLR